MTYQLIEVPVEEVVDGVLVYNDGSSAADADPKLYHRLRKAGKHEKAEKMLATPAYYVLNDDGTFM